MLTRSQFGNVLLAVTAGLIGLATLPPGRPIPPDVLAACAECLRVGLADISANLILFFPFGIALRIRGARWPTAVLVGAVLSGGIELAQVTLIPARDATPSDLIANTAGTLIGWATATAAPRWLDPATRIASRLVLSTAALGAAVLSATGPLFQPSHPETVYYAQWTADLGFLAWYRGRILEAAIGPEPAPDGPFADSDRIRSRLRRGEPIRIRATAGPPIAELGPLFSIYDDQRREILLLGPDRDDLVYRFRSRAFAIGLDQADLRVRHALAGITEGARLDLTAAPTGSAVLVGINDTPPVRLGYTVGDGWSMIHYPEHMPSWLRRLLGILWVAGIAAVPGFWSRTGIATVAAGGLLGLAMGLAPLGGLLATPWHLWLGAVAGWGAGVGLSRLSRRFAQRGVAGPRHVP